VYLDGTGAESPTADLTDCVFADNIAAVGGALGAAENVAVAASAATFSANRAVARGGAAALAAGATLSATACSFSNSRAREGGAIFATAGHFSSGGANAFSNNTAAERGGVVYLGDGATAAFAADDAVSDNGARGGGGGVVFFEHVGAPAVPALPGAADRGGNFAAYGPLVASAVAAINASRPPFAEASGVNFEAPITITAVDALGQRIRTPLGGVVALSPIDEEVVLAGFLKLPFEEGLAVTAYALARSPAPDATVGIRATLALRDTGETYSATVDVEIRGCVRGEAWSDTAWECIGRAPASLLVRRARPFRYRSYFTDRRLPAGDLLLFGGRGVRALPRARRVPRQGRRRAGARLLAVGPGLPQRPQVSDLQPLPRRLRPRRSSL